MPGRHGSAAVHARSLPPHGRFGVRFGAGSAAAGPEVIVANNLKQEGAGFGTDTNIVTFITADDVEEMPIMSKEEVAFLLLKKILKKI